MSRAEAYLLDSHALLWWWFDPERLSTAVCELLSDPATPVLVSAASVWELTLRHHQGKLPELSGAIADLPGLVQAELNRLVLLTADPQLSTFPCQTLW